MVLDDQTGMPLRKPGQHAHLTIQGIVAAGFEVLEECGLEEFSGRLVAKRLGVSPGALHAHLKGGFAELKRRMAFAALAPIVRPYRRRDTPQAYFQNLLFGLLKAINGKQPLAELVALELSADYLLCPMLIEGLLSVPLVRGKVKVFTGRRLDVAMTAIVGMLMIEGETRRQERSRRLSYAFIRRVQSYPPEKFPKLLANSGELMMQIMRRLGPNEGQLRIRATAYAQALVGALAATTPKTPLNDD